MLSSEICRTLGISVLTSRRAWLTDGPRNKEFIEAIELWKVNWNLRKTLRAWAERPVTCCEMPENHFTRIGMGRSGSKRKDDPGQMKIFSRFSYPCRNTTPSSPNRFLLVSSGAMNGNSLLIKHFRQEAVSSSGCASQVLSAFRESLEK